MEHYRNRRARSGLVTYMWLSGHIRNVGDSMLRRPYAEVARKSGSIRVWSAAPGSGYEKGLRLQAGEASRSFAAWYFSFARSVILSKPRFAFNAGEFGVTKAYFVGMVMLLPWLTILRLKGGDIIWIGASIRRKRKGFMWPFNALMALCTELYWRDSQSPFVTGIGGVAPDWGFSLSTDGIMDLGSGTLARSENRAYLAVSLRGDRTEPSTEWTNALEETAARLGLKLVFVAQVQDDDSLAKHLARKLGAKVCGWSFDNHFAQEMRVRSVYRQSELIISDRLHGLIIGASEGAIPLAWTERDTSKVKIHMGALEANWVTLVTAEDATTALYNLSKQDIYKLAKLNRKLILRAKKELARIVSRLTNSTTE